MNKVQLYNEILTLLPLSRTNEDFRDDLHNAMQRYFDITNESDTEIKNEIDNWSATIDKVHSFAKGIEKCVDFYFEGLHSDAFLFLKKHLLGDGQNNGVLDFIDLHTISKGTSLYRGRLFDHKRQRTYKDMFHIPLNKRGIVKTHRYSAPGYPCLYLGATVYACWEELQRPTFNDLMLSAFRTTRDIQLFDIRRPSVNDFNADKLISTLIRLPLIIASSFKVSDNAKDDDFKPEYIIPQLLIELIIRKNRIEEDAKTHTELILGVIYTSSIINNDFGYANDVFDNIAMPVLKVDKQQTYCMNLAECFEITDPTCYEYESIKGFPLLVKMRENPDASEEEKQRRRYDDSNLMLMERRLQTMQLYQYTYILIPCKITFPAEGGTVTFPVYSNTNLEIQ